MAFYKVANIVTQGMVFFFFFFWFLVLDFLFFPLKNISFSLSTEHLGGNLPFIVIEGSPRFIAVLTH